MFLLVSNASPQNPMINAGMVFTDRHAGELIIPKEELPDCREACFWNRKVRKQDSL